MFDKMKSARQVKQIKQDLTATATAMTAQIAQINGRRAVVAAVQTATENRKYSLSGAQLVETRVKGGAAFASMPVKIGNTNIRVGGAVPIKSEEMTVIDQGVFSLDPSQCAFVGGKHSRTWEFDNLVGYVDTSSSELLIAVSNRQKMSGIRYGAGSDYLIDSLFSAFYTIWKEGGDTAEVDSWVASTSAELQAQLDQVVAGSQARLTELANSLGDYDVPAAEVEQFVASLPGIGGAEVRSIE